MPDPASRKDGRDAALASLAAATAGHARGLETPTSIPRLTIWRSPRPTPTAPAMFGPKAYLLLQGAKELTIAHRTFASRPGDCSVSAVGLPFSGRVVAATPEAPYLGLALALDPGLAASVMLTAPAASGAGRGIPAGGDDEEHGPAGDAGGALYVAPAPEPLIAAFARLVALLASPEDIPVLLPLVERELYYRLLQSRLGPALGAFVRPGAHLAQIQRAVAWLGANAARPMEVGRLAATVGMSPSSFHRHFRAVTALSPLAYQRRLRLFEAQRLLVRGDGNVTRVAFAVGYASASQFSREYTRLFGVPPSMARRATDPGIRQDMVR